MTDDPSLTESTRLPAVPIDRLVDPVNRFLHVQSASGVVLLLVTVAALVLANSPWSDHFLATWKLPLGFSVGHWEVTHSLKHWINDGLMVLFFFVIGLEVKREIVLGELQDLRTAALPLAAALGGMVVPASLYLLLQWGTAAQRGWGIPMATDIAFVVGCLAVLGSRVPRGLRILLLSLAIADDVGAILVIAVGYSGDIHWGSLSGGLLGIGLVVLLARVGVRSIALYVLLGVGVWWGFHESGVHATLAGVVLGLLTPARPWVNEGLLARFVRQLGDFLDGDAADGVPERRALVQTVARAARETASPLERLEHGLHPWVSFIVLPLFALANAGVPIQVRAFTDSVTYAVMVGLALGKPLGIVLFSWLAVRAGIAKLPPGVSWGVLAAGGVLAGIGFTMSLFIAGLALGGDALDAAKIGILSASALCAVLGMALLYWLLHPPVTTTSDA